MIHPIPDTFNQSFLYLLGSVTQANATFFVDPKTTHSFRQDLRPKRVFAENGYEDISRIVGGKEHRHVDPGLALQL